MEQFTSFITSVAEILCGYPLFILLIGGGLYLFIASGAVSLRRLPAAVRELRRKGDGSEGQISSVQALASTIGATVGLGSIAGVAIALVLGGPGAIFWMWVSAIVGMCTKYHEGVLTTMFKGTDDRGIPQLTEAFMSTFSTPESIEANGLLSTVGNALGLPNAQAYKLLFGSTVCAIVALVIYGGIGRIARVASILVPFMVGLYFVMVLYIIVSNIHGVPAVVGRIFSEAFNLRAGFGAFVGIAIIGARRAALVNDAGIGTATLMHGASRNQTPVREGLIAMLGPSIDSGLVCTLTAIAILLCGDIDVEGVQGLQVAVGAFSRAIPGGQYLLMLVVACFALSSMFSYSFYGTTCARYLFGTRVGGWYRLLFILSMVVFAMIPLEAAVGVCDLFYALMAFATMSTVLVLSGHVRRATREYFSKDKDKK